MNTQAYNNLLEESDYKMNSVLQGVASGDSFVSLRTILERLSFFEKFEELDIKMTKEDDEATVSFLYKEKSYSYVISIEEVSVNHLFNLSHQLTDIETERLRNAQVGITITTHFNDDNLSSYHLQIKVLCTILPNLSSIVDHSSLSILSGKWAKLCAESEIPPPPSYLYRIHAVSGENNDVWLHTHGLNRCGAIELEILGAEKENEGYRALSSILETLAIKGIDNNLKEKELEPIFLGHDIVVTWKRWEETIEEFNCLGASFEDRVGHDAPSGVVFLYKSKADYENKKLNHLNEIVIHLQKNPLFFISDKETKRMKKLALERLDCIYENAFKNENKILIKVGVEVDEEHKDDERDFNTEHLWFELVDITEGTFTGVLLNQPYYIERLKETDQFQFIEEEITDWVLYTNENTIYPDTIYLLNVEEKKEIIDISVNREAFVSQLENWHEIDKHQEIIEACRKLESLDFEVSSLYSRALNNFGLFEEAIKEMLVFKEQAKNDFKWHYRLSYSYNSMYDYEKALKAVQDSIALKDDYGPAWIQLGFIYDNTEKYEEALKAFDKVISLYEEKKEASNITNDEVDYIKQVYSGIQAVIERTKELDLYNMLIDLKHEENYEEIKTILTNYEINKYHFQLLKIEAFTALKEYDLALENLEKVAKENQEHSQWLFSKYAILKGMQKMALADEAHEAYEKAKFIEEQYVRIYNSDDFISVVLNTYKPEVREFSSLIENNYEDFKMQSYHWERLVFNYIQEQAPELLKYLKFELDGDEFCVFYFENIEENAERAGQVESLVSEIIENTESTMSFIANHFEKINE